MKTYLLSAAGAIFLSVIVTLLVPEGKLHKTIAFVMRLICIFVLVQPLARLFQFSDSARTSFVDYEYVEQVYSAHQSGQLGVLLKEQFGVEAECYVDIEYIEGEFAVSNVEVALADENEELVENIYAYLSGLGYINITVYATGA